jgi:predicted nucleotidyltransferase
MDRDRVITTLKQHEQELRAAGVVSVSLFGSMARGGDPLEKEYVPPGDVDLAVRLADNFSEPGLDYVGRLEDLEHRLSQILGCNVDVIEEPVRKERFQREIDRDRAIAF